MTNTPGASPRDGCARCAGPESLTLTAARLAVALTDAIGRFVQASGQNLGHVETQVAQEAQALLRQATETAAQQKADATPPRCPDCGRPLSRLSPDHARSFDTRFGTIRLRRTRGYCKRCRKWRCPADAALGLDDTAGYSPAVQEMAALVVTKMPVSEARVVLERLVQDCGCWVMTGWPRPTVTAARRTPAARRYSFVFIDSAFRGTSFDSVPLSLLGKSQRAGLQRTGQTSGRSSFSSKGNQNRFVRLGALISTARGALADLLVSVSWGQY